MYQDFDFAPDATKRRRDTVQAALAMIATFVVGAVVLTFALNTSGAKSSAENDNASANIKFYEYQNGLAVGGYDVVAYFTESQAQKGNSKHVAEWGGQTWHFANAENREQFIAEPLRYIPQYGGHCAYGVASGYLVRGAPKAWSIKDGKLYLNYSLNIRTAWLANADSFLQKSESNWPELTTPATDSDSSKSN